MEENQRLQRKLESLIKNFIPLPPPITQTILQDVNEKPHNKYQNQDGA